MRFVRKSPTYSEWSLEQAALQRPQTANEARTKWKHFDRSALFKYLFEEQYGLCAYTELNIQDFREEEGSYKGAHIEHIKPKSQFPQQTFDYFNLMLSALDSDDLAKFDMQSRFGGHHKLDSYDGEQFLPPLLPNISDYFVYSSEDGEIFPSMSLSDADKSKAQYTIDLLNLNAAYLKNSRKNWLQELEAEIDRLIDEDAPEAIEFMAECELLPYRRDYPPINAETQQLRRFHTACLQVFGAVGKRVLSGVPNT